MTATALRRSGLADLWLAAVVLAAAAPMLVAFGRRAVANPPGAASE